MPLPTAYYKAELTLPDILYRAIRKHPDLFIAYSDKNGELEIQNVKDLLTEAEQLAGGLYALGLRQGDKVILALNNNRETVELLWGCFLLGLIPTILQPPMTFSGYNPPVVKLLNIFEQLGRPYVFLSLDFLDTDVLPRETIKHKNDLEVKAVYPKPKLNPDDLAFIQFSSGSTGEPKGVMLTHANLMVNMEAIRIGLDLHFPDHIGNWMPLFHDMGLIGYHLTPLFSLSYQYLIETYDFIMNPGLWLNLMSQHKVSISGCTNFGLALFLRYFHRKNPVADWNLSAMRALLNGAEPISVTIMKEFMEVLKPYGFRPEAMMPVYGMAEATLAVSFTPLMEPSEIKAFDAMLLDTENRVREVDPSDPEARILSEVGLALNEVEIRITDEHDQPVQEGNSGHIQLRGAGVTRGYYNNPPATEAAFCGEWLRTGDIGFFYKGRLYISGRYKDIIFKYGRNYFANDLEAMACTLEEIDFGKICFGGTTARETGQDKVIAFVAGLHQEKSREVFRKLRALLRSNLGITMDELILVKSNEIPKTSSGKLQRFKLMQRYVNGDFNDRRLVAEHLDGE